VTLVNQFAGRTVASVVPSPEGVARTERVIESGLRGKVKLPNGRVLIADHGLLETLRFFDEKGELVDIKIVREHGGYPTFRSGGELFCETATAAWPRLIPRRGRSLAHRADRPRCQEASCGRSILRLPGAVGTARIGQRGQTFGQTTPPRPA